MIPFYKSAVLIPCKNEAATIVGVVHAFQHYFPDSPIIVGDNCCTDQTRARAAKAGAKIVLCPEPGKGNALRTMIEKVPANYYILTDGDGTYSARDARKLYDLAVSHHDAMVIGDRLRGSYFKENKSVLHALGNRMAPRMVQKKYGGPLLDVMTGLRVIRRDFLLQYPITSKEFTVETELTINLLKSGASFESVQIDYRNRPKGSNSKIHSLKDGGQIIAWILKSIK